MHIISHIVEITLSIIGILVALIAISFMLLLCKKRRITLQRRLSVNKRKDLGHESNLEPEPFNSPTND